MLHFMSAQWIFWNFYKKVASPKKLNGEKYLLMAPTFQFNLEQHW